MTDIISADQGEDFGIYDTEVCRAANILSVQYGALEYAPTLGIDLAYFLSEDFKFQNESFQAYLIQVLATANINVSEISTEIESLCEKFIFNISPNETSTALIER